MKPSRAFLIIGAALLFSSVSASAAILEIQTPHGPVNFEVSDLIRPDDLTKLKLDLTTLATIDLPKASRSSTSIAIFGADTTNYFDWFTARVKSFEMNPSSPVITNGNSYSYTAASYQPGQVILLDDYFLETNSAVRMGTLIHEARHGDNIHHVTCSRSVYPRLRSSLNELEGVCDADEKGAYGAQFIFELDLISRNPRPNHDNFALADDLSEVSGRFLSAVSRSILGAEYTRVRHTARFLAPLPW